MYYVKGVFLKVPSIFYPYHWHASWLLKLLKQPLYLCTYFLTQRVAQVEILIQKFSNSNVGVLSVIRLIWFGVSKVFNIKAFDCHMQSKNKLLNHPPIHPPIHPSTHLLSDLFAELLQYSSLLGVPDSIYAWFDIISDTCHPAPFFLNKTIWQFNINMYKLIDN